MATLRSVGLAAGLVWMVATGGAARATECCVLNPNLRIHSQGECNTEGDVETCSPIEKLNLNKPALLSFLDEEVAGDPFPSGAFIYVCPIDGAELLPPTSNMSFVKDSDGAVIADVTAYLKFFVYFDQLIWQGTHNNATTAEKSKDEFPMAFLLSGSSGGATSIRLTGVGKEKYNAKPLVEDNTQHVSANVSGHVATDPDTAPTFRGVPVLVEGKPVCTTNEVFDRN